MIRKIIFAVGGEGTRLHPLTLTTPKNLIPVQGVPLLRYHIESAHASGITDIILVTKTSQRRLFEDFVERLIPEFPGLTFHFRTQDESRGDGHAVFQARDLVGGEVVMVRFPDDLIIGEYPVPAGLKSAYDMYPGSYFLLMRVPKEDVSRWGVVAAEYVDRERKISKVSYAIEKPNIEDAPSNLVVQGGYILTPIMFEHLAACVEGRAQTSHKEIRLMDAFRMELARGGDVYGWEFPGHRLDCGTLSGLSEAETFLSTYGIPLR